MAITPITDIPQRGTSGAVFAQVADALLAVDIPRFVSELNAVIPTIDAAAENAEAVEAAAAIALAAVNFKGNWSSLTGPLAVPSSVAYQNLVWLLLQNIADVTTQTPVFGSAYWQCINPPSTGSTIFTAQLAGAL